jgi:excisionase family DNA binding protein
MSTELMNTKEVAKYLNIHEKQVYLLIKAGKIPCSRVTGKWIFPKKNIDEWIELSAGEGIKKTRHQNISTKDSLLASGSNDPVLDMLLSSMKKKHPTSNIFSAKTGSISGVEAFNSGNTDIAFSHMIDPESGDYNTPFLQKYCSARQPVVVNLFYRQIGFLINKSKAHCFKGWKSLSENNVRFINRQKGSGIRILLDQELEKRGLDHRKINGYDQEVLTHFEVGLSLISNEADVGIGSAAVSKILDLDFQPLVNERFDMIIDKDTFFLPVVQAFIETLQSDHFKQRVERIGYYSFKDSGRILYS